MSTTRCSKQVEIIIETFQKILIFRPLFYPRIVDLQFIYRQKMLYQRSKVRNVYFSSNLMHNFWDFSYFQLIFHTKSSCMSLANLLEIFYCASIIYVSSYIIYFDYLAYQISSIKEWNFTFYDKHSKNVNLLSVISQLFKLFRLQ